MKNRYAVEVQFDENKFPKRIHVSYIEADDPRSPKQKTEWRDPDLSASDDERSTRKRKLIQHPSAFCDSRKDQLVRAVSAAMPIWT